MPPFDLKTLIRTAQVYFPWAVDAKASVQRTYRRALAIPFEDDFRYLGTISLPAGRVVVDVGANRGQSIDAIRMMQPHAVIHSFEPNPLLAQRLRAMYRNDRGVVVHSVGLGHELGEFTLHVPIYRGFVYDALASFDRDAAASWLPGRIIGFRSADLEVRAVQCKVETLDCIGLDPCFVKIDVQGWEKNVLLGGMQTLERARPTMLLETPDETIVDLLAEHGYAPHGWAGTTLRPGHGALNTFFLPAAARTSGVSSAP